MLRLHNMFPFFFPMNWLENSGNQCKGYWFQAKTMFFQKCANLYILYWKWYQTWFWTWPVAVSRINLSTRNYMPCSYKRNNNPHSVHTLCHFLDLVLMVWWGRVSLLIYLWGDQILIAWEELVAWGGGVLKTSSGWGVLLFWLQLIWCSYKKL